MSTNNKTIAIKNSAILTMEIEINKPIKTVYKYIIYKLKDNYTSMAEGHLRYDILNSDHIEKGAKIDCREKAGNQTAYHIYEVKELIPNEHISFLSSPSKVYIEFPWKTAESISNTYCNYDFKEIDKNKTSVQLIITIQFGSRFEKFYSTLFGGINPWKKHQKEEMTKLKALIESN